VFEHGERFRFESTSDAVDGTLRYDEHRLGSIRTGGHVEGVIVYTTDVTDRRADERRLRTQASVLATATSVVIGSERFFITVRKDITELRRLAAGVLRISQHEKEQPARKLHDGLGQQLSGISFLASSLRAEAARTGSPLAPQAEQLAQRVSDAVGSARRMAQGATEFAPHHGGLDTALHELGAECERLAQVRRLIGYRAGLLGAALAVRAGNGRGHEIEVSFPLAALGDARAGDER
jgi:signal transduction histidine kinase